MNPRPSLPERARLYLAAMPAAVSGGGGHDATFSAACALVKGFGLSVDEARPLLLEYNARCLPPWSPRAIEHKLNSAGRAPDSRPRGWLVGSELPADEPAGASRRPLPSRPGAAPIPQVEPSFDAGKLAAFAAEWLPRVNRNWLANRSAVEPPLVTAEDFLSLLYHDGEHVVLFTRQESQGCALWPEQSPPDAGPEGVWFLAQPTDGQEHDNPRTGKPSRRSEESVTAWRFLVLESDRADAGDWTAALVQLPLPIAAVYTSGGRSIHALVQVDAPTKAAWDRERDALRPALVTLGADPRALSAVRLTRLPGCRRGARLQRLLYLNPAPAAVPICELPPLRDGAAAALRAHAALRAAGATVDDPSAPAGLLRALRYYGRENPACAAAAALWQGCP